ncbi:hypothetical protein HanXRQr2_Chr13g0598251 [Helianthus annuus]|uniref:Uncharacterized protein n=1 Tax=Helianthus annuus TaxID=4232 RepID=A0A9K3EJA8_HELAN|nr:hypothetical protein HanXRQr2_Chr13g0598251 [Helianthus annuus]
MDHHKQVSDQQVRKPASPTKCSAHGISEVTITTGVPAKTSPVASSEKGSGDCTGKVDDQIFS